MARRLSRSSATKTKTKVEFDKRNDDLFTNASEANKFANILGPIMNALGYFLYVLIAVLGGGLALAGVPNLTLTGMGVMTLGGIASFLAALPQLRYADQPGHAADFVHHHGYGRRFPHLLCSMPRAKSDEGYVTLVNAEKEKWRAHRNRQAHRLWAWKHPHKDGTVTYTELTGHVELEDVDFGYTPRRPSCMTSRFTQSPPEGRVRRRNGRRQNDHHKPHQPLL